MAGEGWGGGRGSRIFQGERMGSVVISRVLGESKEHWLPVRYKKRKLQNLMRDWVNFLATQPKSSKANQPPLPTQTINKDMSLSDLKEQT